jgi:hypothetical protein
MTPNGTFKITLEPGTDAIMRRYCHETGTPINQFVKFAIGAMCARLTKADVFDVPSHSQIYGRLSEQSLTVRLTKNERRELEKLAVRIMMPEKRSYSRLIRFAVSRACQQISFCDGSRPEQSPAPACEGSPPP